MVKSLQFHDENDVSTPVNWQPGTPAVMGAPLTLAEAEARMDGSDASLVPVDWYLTLKK